MYEIKKVDLHQAVKTGCLLGFALFGLAGIFESVFFLAVRGNIFSLFRIDGTAVAVISLVLVIGNILIGLSLGCIVGGVGALVYNKGVKRFGGIQLDLVHLQIIPKEIPEKTPPASPQPVNPDGEGKNLQTPHTS